jgi:GNAT superfamily N-acetyltransferase
MIAVRPFAPGDAPALAAMMREMARFYGAAVPPDARVEDALIAQARSVDILLAFAGEELAGFATFSVLFPVGGLLSFVYVQQVYVGSGARRRGVARQLMAAIARTARTRGCHRLEWSTGVTNAAARALYDGLGAIGSEKVQYVLEGDALDRLAAS